MTVPHDHGLSAAFDDDGRILVLKFDSDNPEFYRGFEAGLVWAHAYNCRGLDAIVHTVNAEMVMRICEALSLPFRAEPIDDNLMRVKLGHSIED